MKYEILNEQVVFDDHYKMLKAQVKYDAYNGESITTTRLAFERGDSVAILLFDKDSGNVLLTEQFRYPTCRESSGWILEIVAGSLEENESPEECMVREVMEETGYEIENPGHLSTFYTSPGASTERMFLFYAEVSQNDKRNQGGGNQSENEDIKLISIPKSQIRNQITQIEDSKTLIALQWFLLNKMD